ncbi:MAG: hypothetical protein IKO41_00430 [Lachnospiraceae bacterium]|nr:hypothetical protein [Lachnospiraceae bacterium]
MYKQILESVQKETGMNIKIAKDNPLVLEAMVLEGILDQGCKNLKNDTTFYTNRLKGLFKELDENHGKKLDETYNKMVKRFALEIRDSNTEAYDKSSSRFVSDMKEVVAAIDRKQTFYLDRMQKTMEKCMIAALAFFLGAILMSVVTFLK